MAQCYFCRVMPGTQNNTATIGGEKTKKGGSVEATLEADVHGVHVVSSARGRLMMKNLWVLKKNVKEIMVRAIKQGETGQGNQRNIVI